MFLSALWLLISFYKSKGNIINCHESWKKFVLFPTKWSFCKYWFISASNQLISTFWSENKFYSNFFKYLKRIASSNMIRLYYTKTMLYDAIYWGDSRSNFLNMMNTDNPHREFVHHILTLLWIDHNVSLSRGYVNVGLFACSVWYE